MLKYYSIISICCLAVVCNASAQVPSDAQLDELFRVTKVESLFTGTPNELEGSIKALLQQSITQKQIPPPLVPEVNKLIDATVPKFRLRALEQIKPKYFQLCRETFTQQEVVDIISFYNTPSGQALVNNMPVLMQNFKVMIQQMVTPLAFEMIAELQSAIDALKQSGKRK